MSEIYVASGDIRIDAESALLAFDKVESKSHSFESTMKQTGNTSTEASGKFSKFGEQLNSIGEKAMSTGKKMTLGFTTPFSLIGKKAIDVGMNFESEMSKVSAISGATGEDFLKLKAKAEEMGSKTKFSAAEAGQGLEYMAMAGWKTNDMLNGIEPILNLAIASGEELGTTSDIVTDALSAFGLQAKDAGMFSDVLAAASSNANTNVGMMGETFKYAAPVAGSLGYTIQDTALAIGLMANSGIKASQAGTALRSGLTRLAKPTGDAAKTMKKYGISIKDSHGKMKSFKTIMSELRQKIGHLDKSTQAAVVSTIFGQEAMSGWLAVINSSSSDFDKLSGAIENSQGATQKMADTMNNNVKGSLAEMRSALEESCIKVFEALAPRITDIAHGISNLANKFSSLSPGVQKFIVYTVSLITAIGPLLIIFAKTIKAIGTIKKGFSLLNKGIKSGIVGVKNFTRATKSGTNAIGKFGKGIVSVTKAIGKFIINLAKSTLQLIKNGALWVANKVKMLAYKTAQIAVTGATKAMTLAQKALNLAMKMNPIGLVITLLLGLAVVFVTLYNKCEWFRNGINKIWSFITSVFTKFSNFLTGIFTTDWTKSFGVFGNIINGFVKNIENRFNAIKRIFSGVIEFVKGVFTGDWSRAWQGVVDIFGGIMDGLGAVIKAPLNTVISLVNMAIDGLNKISFTAPDWIPGVGGKHFGVNIPKMNYLYTGAVFDEPTLLGGGNTVVGDKFKGHGKQREYVLPDDLLRTTVREEVTAVISKLGIYIDGKQLGHCLGRHKDEIDKGYQEINPLVMA